MDRREFTKIMGAVVAGMAAGSKAFAGEEKKAAAAAKGDPKKHACAGLNKCKGNGGCKTGDAGCSGKNTCGGKGGCATVKHDCAGKNGCGGQGGCKSGDAGCAGKNSCEGKGGCHSPVKKASPAPSK
jgi:hypothetical protein